MGYEYFWGDYRLKVTPHVVVKDQHSTIDGRTQRYADYKTSLVCQGKPAGQVLKCLPHKIWCSSGVNGRRDSHYACIMVDVFPKRAKLPR